MTDLRKSIRGIATEALKNRRGQEIDKRVSEFLSSTWQQMLPVVERWCDLTRKLNLMFLEAWWSGQLDDAWAEYRAQFPGYWLHYYIRARCIGDIKIGKTNHIKSRIKTLLTHVSRGADLIACYPAPREHEKELHDEFDRYRLCGEWFRPGDALLTHLELIGSDPAAFTDCLPHRYHRGLPERIIQ